MSKCTKLQSVWFLQQLRIANVHCPVAEKTVRSLDACSSFKYCRELLDFIPGARVLENKQMTVNDTRDLSGRLLQLLFFFYLRNAEIYLHRRLRAAARVERLSLQPDGSRQERQQHLRIKVSVNDKARCLRFGGGSCYLHVHGGRTPDRCWNALKLIPFVDLSARGRTGRSSARDPKTDLWKVKCLRSRVWRQPLTYWAKTGLPALKSCMGVPSQRSEARRVRPDPRPPRVQN